MSVERGQGDIGSSGGLHAARAECHRDPTKCMERIQLAMMGLDSSLTKSSGTAFPICTAMIPITVEERRLWERLKQRGLPKGDPAVLLGMDGSPPFDGLWHPPVIVGAGISHAIRP